MKRTLKMENGDVKSSIQILCDRDLTHQVYLSIYVTSKFMRCYLLPCPQINLRIEKL